MLSKRVTIGLVAAVGLTLAALSPAWADPPWKHGKRHKHYYHQERVIYAPAPVYVMPYPQPRPRVVYVEPAPVYVYPPPVAYYYPPPGVSLTFNFD